MILKALTSLLLISSLSSVASTENVIWSAVRTGTEIVTSYEVKRYVENVLITDKMHQALFQEANQDFKTYQAEIKKITEEAFHLALKRTAFLRMIQLAGIQNTNRRLFNITARELTDLVNTTVKAKLQPYRDRADFETRSIQFLVDDLKSLGFPHSPSETDISIYKRWLSRITFQIREEVRVKEVFKFLCSIGRCGEESASDIVKRKKRLFRDVPLRIQTDPHLEELTGDEAFDFVIDTSFRIIQTQGANRQNEREYVFIGRVIDQKVEFMAVNDWDITNVLHRLGYPDTDDVGRTSGLMLNYQINGTAGSLSVEIINWLFSEKLPTINDVKRQHVEEEATIRITSRQFLDSKGDRWVVLGVSANQRLQKEDVHSWIQSAFHTLNPSSSQRDNIPRNGKELFLEGIIGMGGQYSIIDRPHVDVRIKGEGVIVSSVGTLDRSRVTFSSSLDANYYLKHKEYPLLFTSIFGSYSFLVNGEVESTLGAKVGIGTIYRNIYWQACLFVIRWDSELDRRYEGGASWTTGLAISATFVSKQPKKDYVFN